jgi:hypothetical protein
MEETLVRSNCGLDTVLVGQKIIHSRYNPLIEAERYVDSLNWSGNIRYIILAECGLCYLIAPLRRKFPAAKIISMHLSVFYAGKNAARPNAEWLPNNSVNRNVFLENEIDDIEADKIKIIEWRPSASAYGMEYLNLIKDITAFVKRMDANKRTQAMFGCRWVKNVIKNCFLFNNDINIAEIVRCGRHCVVAGAGPGLESAYDSIRLLVKNGALLIVVSSAASAALQAGLRPDIIVACDGGNWALLHLFECVKYFYKKESPDTAYPVIAFNLSAALPPQCDMFNLLPFGDGSLFQNITQNCLNIPYISFPQRGTVGASAIDLAFYISSGYVYTAGINFSYKDIRTHAKPYAFDKILFNAMNRLRPVHTIQFERFMSIKESGANKIYADWFAKQMYPREIRAIDCGNSCGIDGEISNKEINPYKFNIIKKRDVKPVTHLIAALLNALETAKTKERLALELSKLLLDETRYSAGEPQWYGLRNADLRGELTRISEKYRNIEARNG